MKKKHALLATFLLFHLFLLFNLQFTAWPEMFSFPYLLNNGFSLYGDMVVAYPPLLVLILSALFSVFGYKVIVLKVFTWSLILASDLAFYLIAKKLFNKNLVVYVVLLFYILLQSFLDGNMLWFDNALTLPVLLVFYFGLKFFEKGERRNLLLIGVFATIAVLIKQTAVIYFVVFLTALLIKEKKLSKKNFVSLFTIPIISLLMFLGYLVLSNQLAHFWNWTIYYPFKYWSKFPNYVDFNLSIGEVRTVRFALLILLPIFFVKKKIKKSVLFVFLFFIASLLAIYPRFSYFHLQPTIPFFVILVSLIFVNQKKPVKPFYLLAISLSVFLIVRHPALISWGGGTRFVDDLNGKVLEEIESASGEDTVFLIGFHSLYYVFSQKLPPKPWLDNYNWHYEIPGVQESVLEFFVNDPPSMVVIDSSANYFPQKIVNWVQKTYNLEELDDNIQIWRNEN